MATDSLKIKAFARMIREVAGYDEFMEEVNKTEVKSFKPKRRDNEILSPDIQKDNWVFDSGGLAEKARILKLLTGE